MILDARTNLQYIINDATEALVHAEHGGDRQQAFDLMVVPKELEQVAHVLGGLCERILDELGGNKEHE